VDVSLDHPVAEHHETHEPPRELRVRPGHLDLARSHQISLSGRERPPCPRESVPISLALRLLSGRASPDRTLSDGFGQVGRKVEDGPAVLRDTAHNRAHTVASRGHVRREDFCCGPQLTAPILAFPLPSKRIDAATYRNMEPCGCPTGRSDGRAHRDQRDHVRAAVHGSARLRRQREVRTLGVRHIRHTWPNRPPGCLSPGGRFTF